MSRILWTAFGAAGLALACSTHPNPPAAAEASAAKAATSSRTANLVLGRVP